MTIGLNRSTILFGTSENTAEARTEMGNGSRSDDTRDQLFTQYSGCNLQYGNCDDCGMLQGWLKVV